MSTPPKTIGTKRKNDGGPANPTVTGRREQIRNAVSGSKQGSRHRNAKISLAPIKFGSEEK